MFRLKVEKNIFSRSGNFDISQGIFALHVSAKSQEILKRQSYGLQKISSIKAKVFSSCWHL